MTQKISDTESLDSEVVLSDAEIISEFSSYLETKYLFETYYDSEYIYINLKTGRLVIPFEDLLEFIDNNYEAYELLGFTVFDLVDTYIMTMTTNTLDDLTNSEFQNASEILLQ